MPFTSRQLIWGLEEQAAALTPRQLPDRAHYGQPTIGNTIKSLLPDAEALYLSTVALKEHLGLAVYRLRGWS